MADGENVYGDKPSIMGEEKLEQQHKIFYAATTSHKAWLKICTNWLRVSFFSSGLGVKFRSLLILQRGVFPLAVRTVRDINIWLFTNTPLKTAQLNRWLLSFLWESGKDKQNQERLTQDKNNIFFLWNFALDIIMSVVSHHTSNVSDEVTSC